MVLARTDPDPAAGHRGLSILIVEKPADSGHGFASPSRRRRKIEGRAIDTIGYRGMHSYEVSFSDWFVPEDQPHRRRGRPRPGFYLQMAGFENGRIQTAARAVGVMQGPTSSAHLRRGPPGVRRTAIAAYQLTQVKLARMAATIQAARQFAYEVARLMAKGEGALEAAMVKAYVCKAAEWVTREAMQIHGGMGYAEEYPCQPLLRRRPGAVDLRGCASS
jgi:(2S)-methylsuccinyl-CoA dehydrogenase